MMKLKPYNVKIGFQLLLANIFLLSVFSYSQSSSSYPKKHFTFHIEKLDTSITFDVCSVNPSVSVNETSSYSWYKDGEIMETKGGFSGRLLDGRYASFFGNKNLRERGAYVKGRKEGKWTKWHPNGKINEVSYWRMGVKQGKYMLYNDLGQRMLYAHFRHDKLNGTLTSYEKDKVLAKTRYKNGVEVFPKLPHEKTKSPKSNKDPEKPSFFKSTVGKVKSLFKKKEKPDEKKPAKEKKKKDISMSSN